MEVSLPNFKITQILPDIFYEDVKLKEAFILKIEKNKTKEILDLLKDFDFNNEKVYLKEANLSKLHTEENLKSFASGKIRNNKNLYECYDISFIKRVKPFDKNSNLVLISFKEV